VRTRRDQSHAHRESVTSPKRIDHLGEARQRANQLLELPDSDRVVSWSRKAQLASLVGKRAPGSDGARARGIARAEVVKAGMLPDESDMGSLFEFAVAAEAEGALGLARDALEKVREIQVQSIDATRGHALLRDPGPLSPRARARAAGAA
jgi:hypothetical protein